MNLNKLKTILNSDIQDEHKEILIIEALAEDESVVTKILSIIDAERKKNTKLLKSLNCLLSKALVGLDDKKFNEGNYMQREIEDFFIKNSGEKHIGSLFKNLNVSEDKIKD